jgi:hypothetical protein
LAGGMSSVENKESRMTDKTAIQRIQELDRERATLFDQAKAGRIKPSKT